MIADTSAWIELLRASGSPEDLRMQKALRDEETILVPEVVYREVLQGAPSGPRFLQLQAMLDDMDHYISADPMQLACSAALMYARCRWQGFTVRSPNDCLVAACAIEAGEALLARDRDFRRIASIEPKLRLIP